MQRAFILVLMAALATGCAGTLKRSDTDETLAQYMGYAGEPVQGFTAMRIQSWQPLARDKLILWTGINEAYLLTVWDNCTDLMFANVIGVTQSGSQVTSFDKVRVDRDRCPIEQIRPLNIKQMKADRAADAASKPKS
jgi:uncharacterized protein YpuA (DUF1002 family)